MTDIVIEYPTVGASYEHDEYGVYAYDTHPENSVLAGQPRRRFLDSFDTLAEARRAYPKAAWSGQEHSGYVDRPIPTDPPAWFNPLAIGEQWTDD
jgi:hypothetical protein